MEIAENCLKVRSIGVHIRISVSAYDHPILRLFEIQEKCPSSEAQLPEGLHYVRPRLATPRFHQSREQFPENIKSKQMVLFIICFKGFSWVVPHRECCHV